MFILMRRLVICLVRQGITKVITVTDTMKVDLTIMAITTVIIAATTTLGGMSATAVTSEPSAITKESITHATAMAV